MNKISIKIFFLSLTISSSLALANPQNIISLETLKDRYKEFSLDEYIEQNLKEVTIYSDYTEYNEYRKFLPEAFITENEDGDRFIESLPK